MVNSKAILRRVLYDLGQRELARVKRLVGSRTLREAMQLIVRENEGAADLFVPHYWAVYYHDGRNGFAAGAGKKLVFFANKNDDPRLRGGRYPVREAQVRRLTRDQFFDGLEINRQRAERGLGPYMYVVDAVGPSKPRPFFEQLEQGAAARADRVVPRVFEKELLRELDQDKATKSERRVARGRIR